MLSSTVTRTATHLAGPWSMKLFGVLFDQLHAGGMYLVAATLCALSVAGLALFLPNVSVKR